MKPVNEYLVVSERSEEETLESGIVVPGSLKSRIPVGTVVAVSSGASSFEVGQRIQFKVGKSFTHHGESYCYVDSNDVYAILDD